MSEMSGMLGVGVIASLGHLAAAVWWYRNSRSVFRGFGTVILGGTGVTAAYIVIRTLIEAT